MEGESRLHRAAESLGVWGGMEEESPGEGDTWRRKVGVGYRGAHGGRPLPGQLLLLLLLFPGGE